MGIIYRALDTTNGKSYVGQTWKSLEQRRKGHLRSKNNTYFSNSLKVRLESFTWEILSEHLTQEELDLYEDKFIVELNTLYPNGYNLKRGGAHGKHTEESRRKISEANKRKAPMSEETKRKISNSSKHPKSNEARVNMSVAQKVPKSDEARAKMSEGAKHPMSDDIREKISKTKTGRKMGPRKESIKKKISDAVRLSWIKRKENKNVV